MAKRDKNCSYEAWEDDWNDIEELREDENKKERQKKRKENRVNKYLITEDWTENE